MLKRSRTLIGFALLALALGAYASAPSVNWTGLTGLYTEPTAESLPARNFAVTFSEIRFVQSGSNDERLHNRDISGIFSYGVSSRFEVCGRISHEVIDFGLRDSETILHTADGNFFTGDVKYVIARTGDNRIGLAAGINDITNRTDKIADTTTGRGIRGFVVSTYRWMSTGVTVNKDRLGLYSGARVALTNNIDLVTEYSWPPVFPQTVPRPDYNVNFNLGLRLYPIQVPGLRADIAAVGDGDFDFGFSFSYQRPM